MMQARAVRRPDARDERQRPATSCRAESSAAAARGSFFPMQMGGGDDDDAAAAVAASCSCVVLAAFGAIYIACLLACFDN
jgi:hypothetical protein